MKTWKFVAVAFVVIFGIVSFIGCGGGGETDKPKAKPKAQSKKIEFSTDLYTTVTGHMTNADWNKVITKLTTALNTASNAPNSGDTAHVAEWCPTLFKGVANINLAKTQDYNYYKIYMVECIIALNADFVISATASDLSAKVSTAIRAAMNAAPLVDGQSDTVTFGNGETVIITGSMTDTNWDIVCANLKTACDSIIADGGSTAYSCLQHFKVIASINFANNPTYQYYSINAETLVQNYNANFFLAASTADIKTQVLQSIKAGAGEVPLEA